MTRDTVGKYAYDIMTKEQEAHSPVDYEREMHKEYEHEVEKCVDYHKNLYDGDFYVVVLTKRERLMAPVMRNFFLARESCPTPTHDQTVYKYYKEHDVLEFIWTIPDKETSLMFKSHALEIVPEERGLLQFVLDFYDGTLDKKAALLNNELDVIGD